MEALAGLFQFWSWPLSRVRDCVSGYCANGCFSAPAEDVAVAAGRQGSLQELLPPPGGQAAGACWGAAACLGRDRKAGQRSVSFCITFYGTVLSCMPSYLSAGEAEVRDCVTMALSPTPSHPRWKSCCIWDFLPAPRAVLRLTGSCHPVPRASWELG